MLQPNFLLTKKIPLTIIRRVAGSYVNGDWVEGTTSNVAIEVNIQPARDHELMIFPESERSKEWYKLYSASEIRTQLEGTGGNDADEFIFEGKRFKVMKARHYGMGILNHHRALAVRIEVTPN
jgi:hypothetical protein